MRTLAPALALFSLPAAASAADVKLKRTAAAHKESGWWEITSPRCNLLAFAGGKD
jgi:hypothetical protein